MLRGKRNSYSSLILGDDQRHFMIIKRENISQNDCATRFSRFKKMGKRYSHTNEGQFFKILLITAYEISSWCKNKIEAYVLDNALQLIV